MSEEISDRGGSQEGRGGNQDGGGNRDGYERVCYLCHRPESKVEKMITIPNNITICSDCMQKTFDQIGSQGVPGMNGMPSFPGLEFINLTPMGVEPPSEFQERHRVKSKKKEKKEKAVLDINRLPAPHVIKGNR